MASEVGVSGGLGIKGGVLSDGLKAKRHWGGWGFGGLGGFGSLWFRLWVWGLKV